MCGLPCFASSPHSTLEVGDFILLIVISSQSQLVGLLILRLSGSQTLVAIRIGNLIKTQM